MKKIILCILPLLFALLGKAQIKPGQYALTYYGKEDHLPSLITAVKHLPEGFGEEKDLPVRAGILKDRNPATDKGHPIVVYCYDTSEVHFFAGGNNILVDHEFRVLENETHTRVPWTPIRQAAEPDITRGFERDAVGYLGGWKTKPGNFLVVDIRKKGSDSIITYAVAYILPLKPQLLNIYSTSELDEFLKRLKNPSNVLKPHEIGKWTTTYSREELDLKTHLPQKLVLEPEENSVIFYLKTAVNEREKLEYQVLKDGEVLTDWTINEFDNNFIWLKNLPPGDYKIRMRYKLQPGNITEYPFLIKRRWDQTLAFQIVTGGSIAAFFGFVFVLVRLRRQKQKLRSAQLKKDRLETELRTIRAQLNPHFVFNALSSIQGLINKKALGEANYYLSGFSNLLRDSLETGDKQMIPLATEIKMLENYIRLEQLRFHFHYEVQVDKNLDLHAIELPSLLLQPLVENAIKHGISELHEKGEIKIAFDQKGNHMIVTISDNGKGFDTSGAATGFGLKLTRERIALLNQAVDNEKILLAVNSHPGKGTVILLTFENIMS